MAAKSSRVTVHRRAGKGKVRVQAVELRDYQRRGVSDIFRSLKEHRSTLYTLPTGAGKTIVVAEVIRQFVLSTEQRVLVLAHRKEIIDQTVQKLEDAGVGRAGVIRADDERADPEALVQVASVQTLVNRSKPVAGLVVIDEAHRATADTYAKILQWYPEAKILGLTATPARTDGSPLSDVFEDLVLGPTPEALVEMGWLARPQIWSWDESKLDALKGVRKQHGDFNQGELERVVMTRQLMGDVLDHWRRCASGLPTVLFAISKAMADKFAKRFNREKIKAALLTGDTPEEERNQILADFKVGKITVLCTCNIVSEGWDMPDAKCAILVRPTLSTVLYLQQVGRVLRPNGETPVILDHAGNVRRHGHPLLERPWSLEGKLKMGEASQEMPTWSCEECGFMNTLGNRACENCGVVRTWAPEVEEVPEEQLVDVDVERQRKWQAEYDRALGEARKLGHPEEWCQKMASIIADSVYPESQTRSVRVTNASEK